MLCADTCAQTQGCRDRVKAYREARVELGGHVTAEALAEIMTGLEAEGLRLVAAKRSAALILEAMQGKRIIPRL